MPERLLVVRHGESTWNASGRWQGWADAPLSDLGKEQAREAAERLVDTGVTAVVASDLSRAIETASIISERLRLSPVSVCQALREFDVGRWSGLTRAEIQERWPKLLAEWTEGRLTSIPGGETRAAFCDRIIAGVRRLAAQDDLGEAVVVVSHGGVIRALEREAGLPGERTGNLSGRWFSVADGERIEAGEAVTLVDPEDRTIPPSY